jgi:hypothetical protein
MIVAAQNMRVLIPRIVAASEGWADWGWLASGPRKEVFRGSPGEWNADIFSILCAGMAQHAHRRALCLYGPGPGNRNRARLEWKLKQLYDAFYWPVPDTEAPWIRVPLHVVAGFQDCSRIEWSAR